MVSKLQYNTLSDEQTLTLACSNLAWYTQQPELVSHQAINAKPHLQTPLPPIETQSLLKILGETNSHFLGPYIEQLWSYYLQHNQRYELVAHNLQINSSEQTIGEFDFIARDTQLDKFLHQEIAVKFYLGLPVPNEQRVRWFGPNRIDRLDKKAAHLRAKQLRLSEHPEAKAILRSKGISTLEKQAILRGRLFLPWNVQTRKTFDQMLSNNKDETTSHNDPNTIIGAQNISSHTGIWVKVSELSDYLDTSAPYAHYCILDKLQWLSLDDKECTLYTANTVKEYAQQHVGVEGRSMLIKQHRTDIPVFVVADHWPEKCYESLMPDER